MLKSFGFFLLKLSGCLLLAALVLIILFRFVPIPYTGVMFERQLEAWWQQKTYRTHHQWVGFDQMSPAVMQAVVAAEDQKFIDHFGFDLKAIELAVAQNNKGARLRGASTISQQTAKNVFLWSGRNWFRKALESGLTLMIEVGWGKKRILEVYLNSVEFGDGIYGVEAAAQHFYGKNASQLNRQEAALLAVVLPNPRQFNVKKPTDYMRKRQHWVLQQMKQMASVRQQLKTE